MGRVPDPRCSRKKKHCLAEILTYLIVAYMTGSTTLRRALQWAENHETWLRHRKGMRLNNGIASLATVSRLLSRVDQSMFVTVFAEWSYELLGNDWKKGRQPHIAVDGKALRGAGSQQRMHARAPLVINAIDVGTGLVLAQYPIRDKGCEMKEFTKLLDFLEIKDSLITIDAAGTYSEIMQYIVDRGAHFVLQVKKNQLNTYKEINEFFNTFEELCQSKDPPLDEKNEPIYDTANTFDKNHGRYEYRTVKCCRKPEMLEKVQKDWWYVKSFAVLDQVRIKKKRDENGNEITPDRETFIRMEKAKDTDASQTDGDSNEGGYVGLREVTGLVSDQVLSAEEIGRDKRRHWTIENCLHHVLDTSFREDHSTATKSRNNLALIRKFAYNLLRLIEREAGEGYFKSMSDEMDYVRDHESLIIKYAFNRISPIY